jgi:hypothetical protein
MLIPAPNAKFKNWTGFLFKLFSFFPLLAVVAKETMVVKRETGTVKWGRCDCVGLLISGGYF